VKVGDLVMGRPRYWADVEDYGIILSVRDAAPGRKNASYEVYWPNADDCRWHVELHIRKIK